MQRFEPSKEKRDSGQAYWKTLVRLRLYCETVHPFHCCWLLVTGCDAAYLRAHLSPRERSEASPLRPSRDIVWISLGGKFTPDVVRDLQTLSVPLPALVPFRIGCVFLGPCHNLSDVCALATSRAHVTATAMDHFAVAAADDLFSVDDCPLRHTGAEDLLASMCVFGAAEVLPR